MKTLGIGIAAAITLAAAVVPANAQGLWLGVPSFGIGIGVGPTPYYGGYWRGPYAAGYGYAPSYAYQGYAYEPQYSYGSYGYVPDDSYAYGYVPDDGNAYGPGVRTYAYDLGYAPRLRSSRSYAYSSGDRLRRTYANVDTRGVIRRDRVHRSTMNHNTRLQDRAAIGAERESAGSSRIRPEGSRAQARGAAQDLRQSNSIEAGKTEKSRVRSQTY